MADGPCHILPDAEGDKCILLEEHIPAFLGHIDGLLPPTLPQREGFVAGKFRRGFIRDGATHGECVPSRHGGIFRETQVVRFVAEFPHRNTC
jgi:hypothetical protein